MPRNVPALILSLAAFLVAALTASSPARAQAPAAGVEVDEAKSTERKRFRSLGAGERLRLTLDLWEKKGPDFDSLFAELPWLLEKLAIPSRSPARFILDVETAAFLIAKSTPESRPEGLDAAITVHALTPILERSVAFAAGERRSFGSDHTPLAVEAKDWPAIRAFALEVGARHPDQGVRATALVAASFVTRANWTSLSKEERKIWRGERVFDASHLSAAYAREDTFMRTDTAIPNRKPISVKIAILRATGVIGPGVPDSIDLDEIIAHEENAQLLTAAIDARVLWATGTRRSSRTIELYPGFPAPRLLPHRSASLEWTPELLSRCEEILLTRDEPELRDAAGRALTTSLPNFAAFDPSLTERYSVHEWGVWGDQDGALVPVEAVLEDLPAFVHRSSTSIADLIRDRRVQGQSIVFKPVIFFSSPEPRTVDLQIRFRSGRPWTYYPEPTDLLPVTIPELDPFSESDRPIDVSPPSVLALPLPALSGAFSERIHDLRITTPPWIEGPTVTNAVRLPALGFRSKGLTEVTIGELGRRTNQVPWIRPGAVYTKSRSTRGRAPGDFRSRSNALGGMGVAWTGLRIGYPLDEKIELEPSPPDHWWQHLRDVDSDSVSLRREREKFLFYDGAVDLPAPIEVGWSDAAHRTLTLRPRASAQYVSFMEHQMRAQLGGERPAIDRAPIPEVYVIEVASSAVVRGSVLGPIELDSPPFEVSRAALDLDRARLIDSMRLRLLDFGLTEAEATSFLETWKDDWFSSPGVRVITFLPRWLYDEALPITIRPLPDDLVRVGAVVRELATDEPTLDERTSAEVTAIPWEFPELGRPLHSWWRPIDASEPRTMREFDEENPPRAVALSPRGNRLASVIPSTAPEGGSPSFDFVLVDLDAGTERTLERILRFRGDKSLNRYSLSFDDAGNRLAIVGRERVRVFDFELEKWLTVPRPDPNFRPYLAAELTGNGRFLLTWNGVAIERLDLEANTGVTILTAGWKATRRTSMAISGDGERVIVTLGAAADLYELDLAKKQARNLTRHTAHDSQVLIASDGRSLIFTSDRSGAPQACRIDRDLAVEVTPLGGTEARAISPNGRYATMLAEVDSILIDLETGERWRVPGAAERGGVSADGRLVLADKRLYRKDDLVKIGE